MGPRGRTMPGLMFPLRPGLTWPGRNIGLMPARTTGRTIGRPFCNGAADVDEDRTRPLPGDALFSANRLRALLPDRGSVPARPTLFSPTR